jgi:prepilin-type N-terminal cleavage/methylation domain-containing protein
MSTTLWSAAIHRRFGRVRDLGGLCGPSPELDRAAGLGRLESGDQSPRAKKGFTLIELLVVVVVIGILSSLVMSGLQAARETAKAAKTRATIAKLHNIIMGMYESYRTRRVPVNTMGLSPQAAAVARLCAIRDIMRLEMPERLTDVTNAQIFVPSRPALSQTYYNRLVNVNLTSSTTGGTLALAHMPAELLYLIVTAGCHARGQFNENEIGVDPPDPTDPAGKTLKIPYFIDGWGHPIFFLRWAPGFADSDIQWNYNSAVMTAGTAAPVATVNPTYPLPLDHDPFDPMGVDQYAWRLIPLIYSAGPDGKYGIAEDAASGAYTWNNDTYYNPTTKLPQPFGVSDGTGGRLDNLHNHRLQGNSK